MKKKKQKKTSSNFYNTIIIKTDNRDNFMEIILLRSSAVLE